MSQTTFRNNRTLINIVKSYLSFRHRPRLLMAKIDKAFILGFFDYITNVYRNTKKQDEPKPLALTTLNMLQNLLTRMLNVAVQEGALNDNPIYTIEQKQKIQKADADRCYLTKEEIITLANTPCVNEVTKAAFMFCVYVGLRFSDVSTLTWSAVKQTDLGKVITLKAMKKTGRQVTVPLNKSALEWMPECGNAAPSERIFNMTIWGNAIGLSTNGVKLPV